ncbi:hypothetical protein niasHT_033092 [Heterodera trifolii]|uniref:Uncharacterized protein n=1 Tax=Heterodera trifolii TaxID=157864 RepID=A0ABD2J779_9BILA
MRSFYLNVFHFLFIHSLFFAFWAECPRKPQRQKVLNEEEEAEGTQPGTEPTNQYIQTTFIHRDANDDDREFAQFTRLMLAHLRPHLLALAHVTVDNENIDCSVDDGHPRCGEYPMEKPFHFLVVEDSRSGAAVYSIERMRNWHAGGSRARTMARIEAALLDALSRHSVHPLTLYASESAANELGFVREVGVTELEQFIRQNHAKRSSAASPSAGPSIFTRSPTELRLLNDRLLARRRVDFANPSRNPRGLIAFSGSELVEMVDEKNVRAVFVLFWHEAIPLSVHSLELWSRASELWRQTQRNDEGTADAAAAVVLGSVACHEEDELCRAFAVAHPAIRQQQQLFAFRNGQRLAQQIGIGDEHFLVEWIRMILSDPLVRLANADEVHAARHGLLPGSESPRAAVTVGTFRSEQQEEFRKFARVAILLHGRYSLAYWLEEKSDAVKLSTFRRVKSGTNSSDLVEMPFTGSDFDVRPLLHHITHASLPDILDIGLGFTTDVPLSSPLSHSLLSLQNGTLPNFLFDWLNEMASELRLRHIKLSFSSRPLLLSINLANSLPLDKLLEAFGANELPTLCLLNTEKQSFRCMTGEKNIESFTTDNAPAHFAQRLATEKSKAFEFLGNGVGPTRDFPPSSHPFALIQIEHIGALFGPQHIPLEPGLFSVKEQSHETHDFTTMDLSAVSGCPMMAHLNQQQLRDEL